MGGVAAPPGLRLVERRAQAHRHHRVLERHALERVDVHVAGGHARHPEPLGQLAEQAVAAAVVAGEGPLELHAEALRPEGPQQPARDRGRGPGWSPASTRLATAPSRAQPERHTSPSACCSISSSVTLGSPSSGSWPGRRPARTPGAGSVQPSRAQRRVRQWAAVISRQRFVYPWRRLAQERQVGAVVERQLGAGDRPHPERRAAPAPSPWRREGRRGRSARGRSWPCSAAAPASSAGCDAPSRNE